MISKNIVGDLEGAIFLEGIWQLYGRHAHSNRTAMITLDKGICGICLDTAQRRLKTLSNE